MTFDFAWLAVPRSPGREWSYIGVLIRGPGFVRFHAAPGFEIPAVAFVRAADLATVGETPDECWDYFMERGGGGLSQFSEPDTLEASDEPAAVAKLMKAIPKPL